MTSQADEIYMNQWRDIVMENASTTGGAKSKKVELTKKFNKYTLDKLQKYAKSKGIKINKRVDGKLVNIKKATLVSKIVKCYI